MTLTFSSDVCLNYTNNNFAYIPTIIHKNKDATAYMFDSYLIVRARRSAGGMESR